MAFRRYAKALIERRGVPFEEWMDTLRNQHEGAVPKDYVGRIAKTILRKCNPDQYLLSHATIVASVDTYAPTNVKTGRLMNNGMQIDVRWPDFRIKQECFDIVNNNGDAWSRPLLLNTYRTFVGAPNYCFVPGTKVLMSDGTLYPIEDISVGDEVIGGSGLPKKVIHKHVRDYQGDVKLIYVGHRKSPIVCTPNHPFARLDRTECVVCGGKLQSGKRPSSYKYRINRQMCISCGRKNKRQLNDIQLSRVAASELEPRAVLFAPIPKLAKTSLKDRNDIRFARMMGFYLAEGCLSKDSNGRHTGVCFTVGIHESDLIQQILDCARALAPKSHPSVSLSKISDKCINIRVYSTDLAESLFDVCGSLAHNKIISNEWINSASPDEIINLIGAYASGDADIHCITQRIRLCSVSESLLQQIMFLGSSIGLSGFVVEHGVKVGSSSSVIFADGSEHQIVSRHQDHVLHFDVASSKKLCELTTTHKKQTREVAAGDLKLFDGKRITFVNKIETDQYDGKVYNLEVEDDHSYVIDGTVLTYNCEHIQLPALSKGFIVDAIARDLGKSVYVDILVATDRKHRKLIQDILSGSINALSMGCHVAGTRVTMADGSVLPIEEIRPEMQVLSQKGNVCRVDNLQIRQNRWSMRRIKASGLPLIESTGNHRYFAVPREKVEYRKVSRSIAPVFKDYPWEYREAGELRVNDIIATPILNETIKPGVSESEARLLGLWIGDGWKFENKHDSTVGIGICCDVKDSELSNEIEFLINQISWRYGEMNACANGGPVLKTVSKSVRRNASYLISTSRAVRSIIDSHVTGRRALNKTMNRDVMSWPINHQLALLSGIIDSDGCVSTTKKGTKQVHISTRNENLAYQYQVLLSRCGIISTLSRVRRGGTKMLPNAAGIDYQIRIRNDGAFKIPSLKIKRNVDKIRYTPGNSDRWIAGGYSYSRIKKIDNFDYDGFVYDLQVDRDHSYVANGIGVSNCVSLFTTCTKCGNVASDDSNLCPCILYEGKGTKFADENGIEHSIAEQVGHVSVPNSNQFIEASWVKNPAFRGAVRRNFLNADSSHLATQIGESSMIHELRSQQLPPDGMKKAAAVRFGQADPDSDSDSDQDVDLGDLDLGGQGQGQDQGQGDQAPAKSEPKANGVDKLVEKAQEQILEILVKSLGEKLTPKPEDVETITVGNRDLTNPSENLVRSSEEFNRRLNLKFRDSPKLVKWASKTYDDVHNGGLKIIKANSLTSQDLILLSWIEDQVFGRKYSSNLYKIAMGAGALNKYPNPNSYLAACQLRLGRSLTDSDRRFLLWKGRIGSVANS